MGVTVLVSEKTSIYLAIELSLWEISHVFYARARSFLRVAARARAIHTKMHALAE